MASATSPLTMQTVSVSDRRSSAAGRAGKRQELRLHGSDSLPATEQPVITTRALHLSAGPRLPPASIGSGNGVTYAASIRQMSPAVQSGQLARDTNSPASQNVTVPIITRSVANNATSPTLRHSGGVRRELDRGQHRPHARDTGWSDGSTTVRSPTTRPAAGDGWSIRSSPRPPTGRRYRIASP